MNRYFVLVRTGGGRFYAKRIAQELKGLDSRNRTFFPSVNYFPTTLSSRPYMNPANTLIHARAAYPDCGWMRNLESLEQNGYSVVNKTQVLKLTSNKLQCALDLANSSISHPKTLEAKKSFSELEFEQVFERARQQFNTCVIKPYTSMEQGANVKMVHLLQNNLPEFKSAILSQPTNQVVIQECIPYTAIYRVIVIGNVPVSITWYDAPTRDRWRVSVCLNRNMGFIARPEARLLQMAAATQRFIGGEINFIDIFVTSDIRRKYVISEINTACNLKYHEEIARRYGSEYWNLAKLIAQYLNSKHPRR